MKKTKKYRVVLHSIKYLLKNGIIRNSVYSKAVCYFCPETCDSIVSDMIRHFGRKRIAVKNGDRYHLVCDQDNYNFYEEWIKTIEEIV